MCCISKSIPMQKVCDQRAGTFDFPLVKSRKPGSDASLDSPHLQRFPTAITIDVAPMIPTLSAAGNLLNQCSALVGYGKSG
jgi:hypothetical protein